MVQAIYRRDFIRSAAVSAGSAFALGQTMAQAVEKTVVTPETTPTERREYCYDQVRAYAPDGEYLGEKYDP